MDYFIDVTNCLTKKTFNGKLLRKYFLLLYIKYRKYCIFYTYCFKKKKKRVNNKNNKGENIEKNLKINLVCTISTKKNFCFDLLHSSFDWNFSINHFIRDEIFHSFTKKTRQKTFQIKKTKEMAILLKRGKILLFQKFF